MAHGEGGVRLPSLYEHTRRIRDFVNAPRKQTELLGNLPIWFQLCSSMDVVEDTELAITAYLHDEVSEDDGTRYLAAYGVLQALFVQQDAVRHLLEALGNPWQPADSLREVRDLRNKAIGHPTNRGDGNSFHFISRATLGKGGFQLLSSYTDGRQEWTTVSIHRLIDGQLRELAGMLETARMSLEEDETAHRARFRDEKLIDLFPPTLSYMLANLGEATADPGVAKAAVASASLPVVRQAFAGYREAMSRRGLPSDYGEWPYIEYALEEMGRFLDDVLSGANQQVDARAARIFAFFLKQKVEQLRESAREIDGEYSGEEPVA